MFNFKSISFKLNIILFITVITVFSISAFITYNKYTNTVKVQLENELNRINTRLELILPSVIWNLQTKLVKDIIKTEAKSDIIDSIEVRDIDNTIIANFSKTKHISKFTENLNIIFENEKIAYIILGYNEDKIILAKEYIIKFVIIKMLVILFILQLIFSFFVNKYIIKNIKKLESGIIQIDEQKDFDTNIQINTQDELHYLALQFNKMKNNLKRTLAQLNNLNKNLEVKIKNEVDKNNSIKEQLFKSEKMASMGEMIGNIAHQWRQPLSVISIGATGLLLKNELGTVDAKEIEKSCNSINDNAQYLSKTIDDFKNFIKGDIQKKEFKLNDNIESFLKLVDASIKSNNILLITNFDENIIFEGYYNELIQCLINIYNNAKDALLIQKTKYIFITTYKKDDFIYIEILDNAGGIEEKIMSKVFNAYFTTKHQSQGTGLGLNMTYNLIVEGMNGNISVENKTYEYKNEKQKGACFKIVLPSS